MKMRYKLSGFSLVEIIVVLAIVAVISVFAIPKILDSQRDANYNARAKAAAIMINKAYVEYKLNNNLTVATAPQDITPYINFVNFITTGAIDSYYNATSRNCNSSLPCLQLHNGGILGYNDDEYFCGTGNNAHYWYFDPDGKVTSNPVSTTGPGKSILFWVYYDGRMKTRKTIFSNTESGWNAGTACTNSYEPFPDPDPPWFSWD